jgi:hypothetical protein
MPCTEHDEQRLERTTPGANNDASPRMSFSLSQTASEASHARAGPTRQRTHASTHLTGVWVITTGTKPGSFHSKNTALTHGPPVTARVDDVATHHTHQWDEDALHPP